MSKKVVLSVLIIILLAGIGGGLYFWQKATIPQISESQRKEDLKKMLGRDVKEEVKEVTEAAPFENDYFSLTLPRGAKRYAADERTNDDSSNSAETKSKDPLLIENMSFDLYEPRIVFVTSVRKLPSNSTKLADISGVNLRKNSPKSYKSEEISKNEVKGLVFTKKESGQFEKTAFFIAKGKLLTFALTSPNYSAEAEQVFNDVFSSLKIK